MAANQQPDMDAFLSNQTRTFFFTLRKDGSPTVHPMIGFYENKGWSMNTYRKSVKTRNIERDPRSSCVIINGYESQSVHAVRIQGPGHVRRSDEFPNRAGRGPRPVSNEVSGRAQSRLKSGKRIIIDIVPESIDIITHSEGS